MNHALSARSSESSAQRAARAWLRPQLRANTLVLALAVFLAGTQNLSFFHQVYASFGPVPGFADYKLLATLATVLVALLTVLLSLLAWPRITKPLFIVLVLVSAVCSYFMDAYGVVIDSAMLVNLAETDPAEASELLKLPFLFHLLVYGLLPAALIWRVRLAFARPLRELLRRLGLIATALLVIVATVLSQYKGISLWGREHRELRMYLNPTYPIYSAAQFLGDDGAAEPAQTVTPLGRDARIVAAAPRKPLRVVLVVGETARADHFTINGYARDTTPRLAALSGLINFPDVWSCGTATATSLPCMFSRLDREQFDRREASGQENLLDVLSHAGVEVSWIDNNSGCKGVCARVASHDLGAADDPARCASGECFDEALLNDIPDWLQSDDTRALRVLHQKGSHGPAYFRRYPPAFAAFTPVCEDDSVQNCPREAIVNAYDNTIRYTDQVLGELVTEMQAQADRVDSVLIYVSDHGESLGENGLYLHGFPYAMAPDEQKHVPMVIWTSAQAPAAFAVDTDCLRKHSRQRYSHDNLFDSLLGLFEVQTSVYRRDSDLFSACRTAPAG